MSTLAPVDAISDEPFRGFEPYRFVDREIFFARERQVRHVLRHVVVYRGVLFFGESGAGKSSLINAGLVPAALDEQLAPERLRVQPRLGQEIVVERIAVDLADPPTYLGSVLADDASTSRVVYSAEEFGSRLRSRQFDRSPLLIFDQFEELLTLFEEAPTAATPSERSAAQAAVVDLVMGLLRDSALPVKTLFVFREDYLAKVVDLLSAYPQLTAQSVRLTAPDVEEIPEIVRGPFKRFPDRFGHPIDDSLASRITADFEKRSVTGRVSLSELQAVCQQLWRDSDAERLFETSGGVQGILETVLSQSLGRLEDAQRFVAVALLSRMVTASGARNVVSEEDLIERVRREDAIPETDLRAGLKALECETRLVRREVRHGVPFYEITSEFLAPWISRQREGRLKDQALSVDQLHRRRRWKDEFAKAVAGLDATPLEERQQAVRRLVSVAIQSRYLDPEVSDRVIDVLQRAASTDDSITVSKEAAKGLSAIGAMEEGEGTPWIAPTRPPPPPPAAFGKRPDAIGWAVTLIAFLVLSAAPMLITGALVTRFARDLGGPELPDVWIWVTVAASFAWSIGYSLEALDALYVERKPLSAPFHPYDYSGGIAELIAGWPIMLVFSVVGGYLIGWFALEAFDVMFSAVWYVAFGLLNIAGLWVYKYAVGL